MSKYSVVILNDRSLTWFICFISDQPTVTGRVENTRVNPDSLIDELLKNSKLDQFEDATECKISFNFSKIFLTYFY